MGWNWLNTTGLVILALILIPNCIYAYKGKYLQQARCSRACRVIEQIGRYGVMLLMIVPLGMPGCEFAFSSAQAFELFLIWLAFVAVLLLAYGVCWLLFWKKQAGKSVLALAVIPCILFIGHGLALQHWLLCAFGALFAAGHVCVTVQSGRRPAESPDMSGLDTPRR